MDKRLYEGMFIVHPGEGDSGDAVIEDIQAEIKKQKGNICALQSMGKRALAYPIKNKKDGYYYLMNFEVDPLAIQKMREKFRINENILRELILKTDEIAETRSPASCCVAGRVAGRPVPSRPYRRADSDRRSLCPEARECSSTCSSRSRTCP